MAATRRKAKAKGSRKQASLSLRALARILRVDEKAIRKGVATGRLRLCVRRDGGRISISNPDLAAKEWAAGAAKPNPNGSGGPTLTQAQVRVTEERADALRLTNDQRRGRLILAEDARRDSFDCARAVRDSLLNLPDRLAAELAAEHDAGRVHARLDEELRKVLETMAEVLAHGG